MEPLFNKKSDYIERVYNDLKDYFGFHDRSMLHTEMIRTIRFIFFPFFLSTIQHIVIQILYSFLCIMSTLLKISIFEIKRIVI